MNKTSKKVFWLIVGVVLVHFSLSYYVAHRIGAAAGRAVASFIIEAQDTRQQVDKLHEEMTSKLRTNVSGLLPLAWALSLPLEPIARPVSKSIFHQTVYEPVQKNKISSEQARIRLRILGILGFGEIFVNSLAFGLCLGALIAVIVRTIKYRKQKSG